MDMYYQKKLIAISNHRFETYVALRFQGLNAKKVLKDRIIDSKNGWYQVKAAHFINTMTLMSILAYTLVKADKMVHLVYTKQLSYYTLERSLLTTLPHSAKARLRLATIALGNSAVKQLSFYSSLHQAIEDINEPKDNNQCSDILMFEGTEWDLNRSNTDHLVASNSEQDSNVSEINTDELKKWIALQILQIEQKD